MKPKNGKKFKRLKNSNSRRHSKRELTSKTDRLSSLPDVILIDILSLLKIKTAAKTSVLSRRWRYLWTAVNRLYIYDREFSGNLKWHTIVHIFQQLTSPNLLVFYLSIDVSSESDFPAVRTCFRQLCARNVEVINVAVGFGVMEVPACVFTCQTLRTLEFHALLYFELPNLQIIRLPNLRSLRLVFYGNGEGLMRNLIKSCPLLEDLDLGLELDVNGSLMDITGLNLKKLYIDGTYPFLSLNNRIVINAPNLAEFRAWDRFPFSYSFIEPLLALHEAYIDFSDSDFWDCDVGPDHFAEIPKFVRELCHVRKLRLESDINIFSYLNSLEYGVVPPVFQNVVCFVTTLADFSGWKDLLITLQRFPNLELLEVTMVTDCDGCEELIWSEPDCVLDCLVSKVKKISIKVFTGTDYVIKLLEYILVHANILEKLVIKVVDSDQESNESILWEEYKFAEALFKLPKNSLACKVKFSGCYISASSDGYLKKSTALRCVLQFGNDSASASSGS